MNEIDYVFPYVNCNDSVWIKSYKDTRRKLDLSTEINPIRFREWDNLKYIFRGIENFMPWVRKIHMIVSNPEQVPDWLDTNKVHIVYHKDIIPEELLPTFNSCTIEMFLKNIEGLSDKFIYANDDMFPIAPMEESDFFENNIPKLSYKVDNGQGTMFKKVEYGCQKLIADYLGITLPNPLEVFMKIPHTLTPMTKETLRVVNRMFDSNIYNSCSPFREEKNFNQYIYTYYNILAKQYLTNNRTYKYFQFKKDEHSLDKSKEIAEHIENQRTQSICINDTVKFNTDEEFDVIKNNINNGFNEILPFKCSYETKENEIREDSVLITNNLGNLLATFTPDTSEEAKNYIVGVLDLVKSIKNGTYVPPSEDSSEDISE